MISLLKLKTLCIDYSWRKDDRCRLLILVLTLPSWYLAEYTLIKRYIKERLIEMSNRAKLTNYYRNERFASRRSAWWSDVAVWIRSLSLSEEMAIKMAASGDVGRMKDGGSPRTRVVLERGFIVRHFGIHNKETQVLACKVPAAVKVFNWESSKDFVKCPKNHSRSCQNNMSWNHSENPVRFIRCSEIIVKILSSL